MVSIFISYAHKDGTEWRDAVLDYLSGLRGVSKINVHADTDIRVGAAWDSDIRQKLDDADIIILILTSGFFSSSYIKSVELARAMKRRDDGAVTVVPIVANFCDWNQPPFNELQLAPIDEKREVKPLSDWDNPNKAFHSIFQFITEDWNAKEHFSGEDRSYIAPFTPSCDAHRFRQLLARAYLVDRQWQEDNLVEALEAAFAETARRPIVGVAAGAAEHRHELLVERFAKEPLQIRSADSPIVLGAFARWRIPSVDFPLEEVESPEHDCEILIRHVARKVICNSTFVQDICRAMNLLGRPCAFSTNIYAGFYDRGHKELLERWVDFWNELGKEPLLHPACLLLCIEEASPSDISARAESPHKRVAANARAIKRDVEKFAKKRPFIRLQPFPDLTNITRQMVFEWLSCERLATYCPGILQQREYVREQIMSKVGIDSFPLAQLCATLLELTR